MSNSPWSYQTPESEWAIYKREKPEQEPEPEARCICGALATVRCAKCCGVAHCGQYFCVMMHNRKAHGSKTIFETEVE